MEEEGNIVASSKPPKIILIEPEVPKPKLIFISPFKKGDKWTSERVRIEGPMMYPDCSYHLVEDKHISKGNKSRFPAWCMIHQEEFWPEIHSHFNEQQRVKGCKKCSKREVWTAERVRREGPLLYPIFLYGAVTDGHISKGANSIIPVWCTIHNISFWARLTQHFNDFRHGNGCRKCSNRELWTAERVQIDGPRRYPEYGYHYVTDAHVTDGYKSIIPVWCTIHEILNWVRIQYHFHDDLRGCSKCTNRTGWDLERFLREAILIHGDTCDYSEIKDEDIVKGTSKIPITCRICHQKWYPTIQNHINRESGCPPCSRKGYSRVAIEWLEYMAMKDNTHIQHARNGGEHLIPGTLYHVDGYSASLNKIYEFNGDYWHGNPDLYHPDEVNEVAGKTMGELFDRTKERLQKILELGYNLECIWERDWRSMKRLHNQPKVITLKPPAMSVAQIVPVQP